MPRIRKTDDTPAKYSVIDVIMLVKGCTAQDAARNFRRLRELHGDGWTHCPPIRFYDSTGRLDARLGHVSGIDSFSLGGDLPQPMRGLKLSVGLTVFASAATCPNGCEA